MRRSNSFSKPGDTVTVFFISYVTYMYVFVMKLYIYCKLCKIMETNNSPIAAHSSLPGTLVGLCQGWVQEAKSTA